MKLDRMIGKYILSKAYTGTTNNKYNISLYASIAGTAKETVNGAFVATKTDGNAAFTFFGAISIGLNSMVNSDMVTFHPQGSANDCYSLQNTGSSVKLDTEQGCLANVNTISGGVGSTYYYVHFSRPLVASDKCDLPIIPGLTQLCWALREGPSTMTFASAKHNLNECTFSV